MNIPLVTVPLRLPSLGRALLLTGTLALAGQASAEYHVTAFAATPGFKQLMSSNYEAAAIASAVPGSTVSRFSISNNRCIAQVQLGDLDAALSMCNAALREYRSYQSFSYLPGNRREEKASLISNRGVVLALQGQLTQAEDDFLRALQYQPEHANARTNLTYLRAAMVGAR